MYLGFTVEEIRQILKNINIDNKISIGIKA